MDENNKKAENSVQKGRQMMDFAPRKSISYDKLTPKMSQREIARREFARQAEERRAAVHRQIEEQKREERERAARARAAREELDRRKEAEERRQRRLELERRREQERARHEAELERNREYEEERRRRMAAKRLAEKEAEERALEQAERRREYEALLERQKAAEAHRQAMKRREEAARARAKRFAEEKRAREAAEYQRAKLAEARSLARTEEEKPVKAESSVRFISGFPRRAPGDLPKIVAPGNRIKPFEKLEEPKESLEDPELAAAIEEPVEEPKTEKSGALSRIFGRKDEPAKEDEGIDSKKLGSLDDFEADLKSLEDSEEARADESLAEDLAGYDIAEDDLDRAISSLDEDDEFLEKSDTGRNNTSYVYGGKSPFINTDKVDKRPLSSIARDLAKQDEMPHKNIYARRVAAIKHEKEVPTMVVESGREKDKSGISLIIAIILTIILGAAVGAIAYLALFQ